MDPWSKVDYSRHIREVSMGVDGLPEVVPPSGRMPVQLFLATPILKRRWRRYREEIGKKTSILGVSSARGINRRRGASRRVPGAPPPWATPPGRLEPWWVPSFPLLVIPEGSSLIFLYNFSGIFGYF